MCAQFMQARAEESSMSKTIRQIHRWVSALFVLSVIATSIALAQPTPIMWMSYVPLVPLAFLALSGIYLFILPYMPKSGGGA